MAKSLQSLRARAAAALGFPQHPDTRSLYLTIGELVRRHEDGLELNRSAGDLTACELRAFSQNGEDGVVAELLRRIGPGKRYFVEFGAEHGTEGNCVFLADVLGWDGSFIEADANEYSMLARKYDSRPGVTTLCAAVTPANVEPLLDQANVPLELDVLSIDIDGPDFWVWRALRRYRPRVVIIEYNSGLSHSRALVERPGRPARAYDGTDAFGASAEALRRLGCAKGYRLVHTDLCGVNAFFLRDDLADSVASDVVAPVRAANFYLEGRHALPATHPSNFFLDLDDNPAILRDVSHWRTAGS